MKSFLIWRAARNVNVPQLRSVRIFDRTFHPVSFFFAYFYLQLHRLQESVWQSLEYRLMTGPQELRQGTIRELQQCSSLEQSAREVLQDNSRCPSGMLTLTHPVQHSPERRSCRKHSMTTTHPFSLVEGPCAASGASATLISWVAAMVNFKTSPTDS